MKPILTPTATEVVRCVRETMESGIIPTLSGRTERSNAATIQHMLRYVEYRLETEGQLLFDEIAYLRDLFPIALAWLEGRAEGEELAVAIRQSIEAQPDPAVYPSLSRLGERVAMLRQHICDLLLLLQAAPEGDREATALHEQVRAYIVWQLEQEGGKLVEPAFVGHGPRR
ncbi:hypothetical protein [Sphingobium sp.]|uniref:hypothetical protein n=1 Tax=Sphingobium sp. TaxID=1912891 RepID=UPI002C35CBC0|nr:hypothetical protein [Sphingobium sp.]HUD90863.1 hypothetical protein [Sphingobium sp.]